MFCHFHPRALLCKLGLKQNQRWTWKWVPSLSSEQLKWGDAWCCQHWGRAENIWNVDLYGGWCSRGFKIHVFCRVWGRLRACLPAESPTLPCCHNHADIRYIVLLLGPAAVGVCLFMCLYLVPVAWCWRWSIWRDSTSWEICGWAAVSATWTPPSVRPGLDPFRWRRAAGRHPQSSHLPEEEGGKTKIQPFFSSSNAKDHLITPQAGGERKTSTRHFDKQLLPGFSPPPLFVFPPDIKLCASYKPHSALDTGNICFLYFIPWHIPSPLKSIYLL